MILNQEEAGEELVSSNNKDYMHFSIAPIRRNAEKKVAKEESKVVRKARNFAILKQQTSAILDPHLNDFINQQDNDADYFLMP
jgi:hypothetical protein